MRSNQLKADGNPETEGIGSARFDMSLCPSHQNSIGIERKL